MNEFVIPEIADIQSGLAGRRFPLPRAGQLKAAFSAMFSRHLGGLRGGAAFEAQSLLVTGLSGSGKTTEIGSLIKSFNDSQIGLPDGRPARFVQCVLDAKGSWKDLGRKTLRAMGYPLADSAKLTQNAIWERVSHQAKAQGIIGIHYDEAQHILRGRSDRERLAILDAFKTLMKSPDWPFMLILSGIPELERSIREEPQLYRLVTRVHFDGVDLNGRSKGAIAPDYHTLNEIVGSYALEAGLDVDDDLCTEDFLHRLATAGAFRWGLVIQLVIEAVQSAKQNGAGGLGVAHFVDVYVAKTALNPASTPFTHSRYETMFREDEPFSILAIE